MSSTTSPLRRSVLRVLLTVAVIATVLPFGATPAFAAGNQAVSLDGVNDYVDLGASSTSLGANQFTLELWFKRTGAGVTTSTGGTAPGLSAIVPLITKGRSEADGTNVDIAYFLGIDMSTPATPRLAADFEDGATSPTPGANHGFTGATSIPLNVWEHAALTYNGSVMTIYLNGQLEATSPAINQPPRADSIHRVGIGTSFNSAANTAPAGFFAGQMDEVRIWNVARSQAQVQSTMNTEVTSGTGLTGRWGMNEGSGTTAAGSLGGINGTLVNGAAWAAGAPMLDVVSSPGPTTAALRLDGINDHVTLGAAPGLGATNFTLELWFKRLGAGSPAQTSSAAPGLTSVIPLLTKGRSEADGTNVDMNYFLGIDSATGRLAADFEEGATGTTPGLNHGFIANTFVTENVWHHAAVTYDGSVFRVYLDGTLDGTSPAINQPPRADSIQHAAIGTAINSTGGTIGAFAGEVDEARIWNVARTQAEIQGAMNVEIVSPVTGLLGRWGMNAGSGTVAANTAGSAGVSGTLVNGPVWVAQAPAVVPPPPPGNYALQFDGVNDGVTFGAAPSLGAATFTIETWFKRTATGVTTSTGSTGLPNAIPLLTKGRSENDASNVDMNYFLGIDNNTGALGVDYEEGDLQAAPGANHPLVGSTAVTMNVWHHAAATFDGTVLRLYLDGALNGTLNVGPNHGPRFDSIQHAALGTALQSNGANADNTGWFAGTIDEARIWNVARTQAQIQSTMGSEITSGQAGLLGRWGLNEGIGTSVAGTGTTVNGTTFGGPTWVAGTTFTPPNTAPVVDSVAINQATPRTNDTLSATVTSHDPEGNPITHTYQWTKNNVDISGATSATLNLATAGNGDKGDQIRLRVTASDGTLTSAPVTSSPVTIQNTAPTATVSLDDHTPGTNATLTATATKADVDGDSVSLTYVWKVNGTTRQTTTTTALTDTFDLSLAGNGNNGQAVTVTVTPNDGTANGTAVTDTATVGNATPVVDSVTIDQTDPLTNDTLSATVTSHDADGDTLTTDYQWTLDGSDIAGATDSTLDLSVVGNGDKGDLTRVRVTVSDAGSTSAPVTSSPVTVLNTEPTATVSLDDQSPGTNALLTATATGTDDDDDTVTFTYLWTVNGGTVRTTTTTALTDALDLSQAGNGNNGDTIVVTVTPNDGTANGSGVSDTATVGNGSPVVDSVAINEASPRTNDTLSVSVTSHDPDGDTLTTEYQWTLDGSDIAGATDPTLDLSVVGNGDKGDLIRVRVTVSDTTSTSAPVTSSPVTVLNTAPSATVALDDHSPSTNATLTATATAADADDDTVSLTYVWTVDGAPEQTTTTTALTDSFDLSVAGNGDNGQTVVVTVTPNDGTANGAPASDSATIGNEAPVVDTVAIVETTPRTNDTLSATVTSHDPDGNPVTYAYHWTLNGADISGATDPTLDLSVAGNGNKGELIRVRVTAFDGSATSAPVTSSPVTVLNTAPTATVSLDDHTPNTNATLTATATRADVDGDTVSLTYLWTVNGVTRQTTNTASLTDTFDLSLANHGNNGDTAVVTVTPNDGTANGSGASDSATVGNAAPVVDSVAIDQTSPRTNDTLTATVVATDPDGGAPTPSYQWTRNGTNIAGATNPTLNLATAGNGDKGDVIRVRVTVSDGSATSGPATSSPVTVLNTVPTATVSLNDHTPGTSATLTATATRADVDGDTVTLTYVWTVNGVTRQTTNTTSLTDTFDLSAVNHGNNGDTVAVTVTPNDGTANGSTATDSATVGNAAPVVDSVVIDQATPRTNDTLSATVTASDPDGGSPTPSYQWTRNGTDIAGATNATLNLATAGNGDKDDLIRVRVTVSDGTATSGPATSSAVTILNTAPTATVSLNDDAPDTNATLTATATMADVDTADTVSLTYLWTVNGVTRQTTNSTSLTDTFDLSVAGNGDPGQSVVVTVTPNDGTANGSGVSDTATVTGGSTPPIFADEFPNLNNWINVTRITIDNAIGSPAAPSARAGVTSQSAFAYRDLGTSTMTPCVSMNVNLASGTGVDLFRLRSASNGAVIKVFVHANGTLQLRSDFGATTFNSNVQVGTGWHSIELCGTVGTNTTWDLIRDGVVIVDDWVANTGTAAVNRIQIGDTAAKTFTANWDHVRVDLAPGEAGGGDTQGPTTPGTPTGSSPTSGTIQISWSASTDASPPITYRVYRDGNPTSVGQTTSTTFNDPGLTPGTSHTYTVDAVDSLNNPSLMSGASASILVSGGDTQGPTTPGTPTGSSPSNGTIQISWSASTDASPPITYRVYRDGNPTSIGQTTSTTFNDPGLTPGTSHTYRVDAVDSLNNPSLMSGASASILVSGPPDTQGPTTPGTPTGASPSSGMIQISWTASTDASPPITYRIYRDGNPTSIGQTTSLTFMDPGLTPGTSHTYTVDAIDSLNNPSLMSAASASILVSGGATPPIFADDFTAGNLLAWTSFTRITIDNAIGSPAAPSARANVTNQSAFAYRDLGSTTMTPCVSLNVNRASGAADLFRLRTAANGAVIKAVVTATGTLQLRSDFSGTTFNSNVALGTGWHSVELCGTVGTATGWNLYRDGVQIVTNWIADTGTIPVGRVQIGDTAAKTFTINFDHVRVDLVLGEGGGGDTQGPTTPGTPTGSSPSNGTIQISWSASTDASPPITYRIYRDGNPTSIGQTTSTTFNDPGLTPGTSHTYRVDAVDSLNNPSLMSGTSASILVSGPPDTQGPTTPGTPTGASPSAGMIQISWSASTDASPPITYRIYRDGNPTSIGQTTSLTFMDPGLTPGTSHTYTVDAIDSLNNPSLMSGASASVLVSGGVTPPIFADDFASGSLAAWTSFTRITVDNAIGSPAAPSARAQVTNLSAFAYRDLPSTTMTPCISFNVNLSAGNGVDLLRLRTLAGGPIIKVVATATGTLQLRSDFGGTTLNSNVQLGTGWHAIELCGTVGGATTWNLYRDGAQIVTNWVADTGTTSVGRVQIGDTAAKTFTANFDNVRLDLVVGG